MNILESDFIMLTAIAPWLLKPSWLVWQNVRCLWHTIESRVITRRVWMEFDWAGMNLGAQSHS